MGIAEGMPGAVQSGNQQSEKERFPLLLDQCLGRPSIKKVD